MVELSRLAEWGSRRRACWSRRSARGLDELAAMAEAGRIRDLPGFGPASEAKILAAIKNRHQRGEQRLLADARRLGASIASYLAADPAAIAVESAGPRGGGARSSTGSWSSRPPAIRPRRSRGSAPHGLTTSVSEETPGRRVTRLTDGGTCELVVTDPEHAGAALVHRDRLARARRGPARSAPRRRGRRARGDRRARRGRGVRRARPAVAAARGPRRRRRDGRGRGRRDVHRSGHARGSRRRGPLPHHVHRRQDTRSRRWRAPRRSAGSAHHDHRSLARRRATPAA